jgi:hypothetical protein
MPFELIEENKGCIYKGVKIVLDPLLLINKTFQNRASLS